MTLADMLVSWAWSLECDEIPEPARRATCRHLLDGLGTALAATRLGAASPAVQVAIGLGGPSEATVIGSDVKLSAPAAAFANGVLVHALDFDDTHTTSLVHPTACVLPAVLAVGEEVGATGREVLTAAVAAYEVHTRLGAAVRHGFHQRGLHATSVCGVFAATLAAARLLRLPEPAAVGALGIAGSQASGILEFLNTGSDTKQLHPGMAAQSGLLAARLAQAGMRGPETVFEGRHGFYRAYADADIDPERVSETLGGTWEVERITVKPYPACQLSHATLDAVRSVLSQVSAEAIESVTTRVPTEAYDIVCEPRPAKINPRTPYEGKFSLPWSVAVLLIDGEVTLDSYLESQLHRDDLRALADRVHAEPYDAKTAAAEAPGYVEIRLRDGRLIRSEVAVSRGGPDNPLTETELLEKFSNNADSDSSTTRALATAVMSLESLDDVGAVLRLCSPVRQA